MSEQKESASINLDVLTPAQKKRLAGWLDEASKKKAGPGKHTGGPTNASKANKPRHIKRQGELKHKAQVVAHMTKLLKEAGLNAPVWKHTKIGGSATKKTVKVDETGQWRAPHQAIGLLPSWGVTTKKLEQRIESAIEKKTPLPTVVVLYNAVGEVWEKPLDQMPTKSSGLKVTRRKPANV